MIYSNPNYFPKTPCPNSSILGIRDSYGSRVGREQKLSGGLSSKLKIIHLVFNVSKKLGSKGREGTQTLLRVQESERKAL